MIQQVQEKTEKQNFFRDIPTEFWLRIIAGLLVVIGTLGTFFGSRLINTVDGMQKVLTKAITIGQVDHERINRIEVDVGGLRVDQNALRNEIYSINQGYKEKHNGR